MVNPTVRRDIQELFFPAVMLTLVTGGTYQTQAVIDKYLDSQIIYYMLMMN